MKTTEHVKSYCRFWKPSVARRITFYFLVFGLIVFFITSMLYMAGTRKHFIRSTSQLINHQFSLMDSAQMPDFLWKKIGKSDSELDQLFQLLANLSSSFYAVSDIAIYVKEAGDTLWYRIFFDDNKVLHLNTAQSSFSKKLNRNLKRHFEKRGLLARSDDEHALFVNVTGENDLNTYFLKIGIDSESFAGIMKREAKWIILIFIIALVLSRFLGYYLARKISRPIENLSQISSEVAKGDLTHLAPVTTGDEFGELSTNFNKMVEGLREWESVKKIEFELEKGREIQREFLPSQIPKLPNWEIATCFYPAGQVSGDFYDVFVLPDGNVGLVIADVCDKGVGSALYMALFRSLIRVFAEQSIYCTGPDLTQIGPAPGNIETIASSENDQIARLGAVSSTNNYIAHIHGRECMYATLFFGVLNPATGIMTYVNGGHEPVIIVNQSGVKQKLKATGPVVGVMPEMEYKEKQVHIEPGDILIGYTDGVTEALSPDKRLFTKKQFLTLLERPASTASEVVEQIKDSLYNHIGDAPQFDDITMIAVYREA